MSRLPSMTVQSCRNSAAFTESMTVDLQTLSHGPLQALHSILYKEEANIGVNEQEEPCEKTKQKNKVSEIQRKTFSTTPWKKFAHSPAPKHSREFMQIISVHDTSLIFYGPLTELGFVREWLIVLTSETEQQSYGQKNIRQQKGCMETLQTYKSERDKTGQKGCFYSSLSLSRDIYIYILGWEMLSTGSFRTLKPSLFLIPLFASL